MEYSKIEDMKGLTLSRAENIKDEEIIFETNNGAKYKLYHSQDCCEDVHIESIVGELSDLVGTPLLQSEEISNEPNAVGPIPDYAESYTWTFYKLATIKGSVVIRWIGTSNGYYSESVTFVQIKGANSID